MIVSRVLVLLRDLSVELTVCCDRSGVCGIAEPSLGILVDARGEGATA